MAAIKFVSYLRVSTDKQGRSGLGLEAQREAVTRYLNGGQWKLVAEYVEVESGKRNSRSFRRPSATPRPLVAKLVVARTGWTDWRATSTSSPASKSVG